MCIKLFQHSSLSRYAKFQFGRFGVRCEEIQIKKILHVDAQKERAKDLCVCFDAWHSFWHI